ncbi:hypothetical protein CROQUDRAFT_56721 [Cronartium quercuum f. sp. fusiforme G11]|uniref:Translin n=1 Tax=Cronartium quercuum f. sp. fusiforme G11 TaxID=708437 RepID=A0A9P6NR39_9BASI|nr:hypothetical protein CROQUDRAFT_56721 [Cronartium quercuum f. sp. fusiforme G11]
MTDTERMSSIEMMFQSLASEIDAHHDRRECIIKLSRDITSASKKVIFHLHRLITNQRDPTILFTEADRMLAEVAKSLWAVSKQLDSTDEFFRYYRSISPGIQEFIEAKTYCEYLRSQRLVTRNEIEDYIRGIGDATQPDAQLMIVITIEDYAGGVADLTGELMRHAINSVGTGSGKGAEVTKEIILFIRTLSIQLNGLAPHLYRFDQKMTTMQSSLKKIENAAYTIKVRGAEYADSPSFLMHHFQWHDQDISSAAVLND